MGVFSCQKQRNHAKPGPRLAPLQLRSRPSCTSRAHKAETQCTRAAQRQRSRCQQQRYNAALHRQSYTLPYSALARQSACMLVLRLHPAATAMSDRTQASFRHRPRRQPPMSRISTHPASIRTGAVHDGGCLLASAADNNLMSSAELEERRQPTLVSPSRTRSLRGSEAPECRAAGATGRRARHSRGGIRFMAFVAAKVRPQDSQVLRRSCVGFVRLERRRKEMIRDRSAPSFHRSAPPLVESCRMTP